MPEPTQEVVAEAELLATFSGLSVGERARAGYRIAAALQARDDQISAAEALHLRTLGERDELIKAGKDKEAQISTLIARVAELEALLAKSERGPVMDTSRMVLAQQARREREHQARTALTKKDDSP